LSASFSISAAYEMFGKVFERLSNERMAAWLNDTWVFMTKFSPQSEETEAERAEREKLEAYQNIVDIGVLIRALMRLTYRNARRAAGASDSFSGAISIFLRLFEKGRASNYMDRMVDLIAAFLAARARTGKK